MGAECAKDCGFKLISCLSSSWLELSTLRSPPQQLQLYHYCIRIRCHQIDPYLGISLIARLLGRVLDVICRRANYEVITS